MSRRSITTKYDKDQFLDTATSKQIGDFMYNHAPDDPGKMTKTRSLIGSAVITGPKENQAYLHYLTLAVLFDCEEAAKMVDNIRGVSIATNGIARQQGSDILQGGRLPREIEVETGQV